MSADADRLALNHRVDLLEKKKRSIANMFTPIDFDQFPENSCELLPEGLLLKYSLVAPFPQGNVDIRFCLFTPRIYGILALEGVLLMRVLTTRGMSQVSGTYRHFIRNCREAMVSENLGGVVYNFPVIGAQKGFGLGPSFGFNMFGALIPNSNAFALQISGWEGMVYVGVYLQNIPGPSCLFTRASFSFPQLNRYDSLERLFLPDYIDLPNKREWRVNTPVDLPANIKPFFPASWSV